MTSTSVVLGIAMLGTPWAPSDCDMLLNIKNNLLSDMLGTPWAPPDCDCATDATGSITIRKAIMDLIGSPLDSSVCSGCWLRVVTIPARNQHRDGQACEHASNLYGREKIHGVFLIDSPCRWRRLARLSDICRRHPVCDTITDDRFLHETGHKRVSRGKELNNERRRSGTSRPDDALSGRITGSISGDVRAARTGSAPVSVASGRRLRDRRRSTSGNVSSNAPVESGIQPEICG